MRLHSLCRSWANVTGLAEAAAQLGDAASASASMAQAAAAYSSGIRQGEAAATAAGDLVDLHRGLAALYRGRVVGADGSRSRTHKRWMTSKPRWRCKA